MTQTCSVTRQLVESVWNQTPFNKMCILITFNKMCILITEFHQSVWNRTHSPYYGCIQRTFDIGNRHLVTAPSKGVNYLVCLEPDNATSKTGFDRGGISKSV